MTNMTIRSARGRSAEAQEHEQSRRDQPRLMNEELAVAADAGRRAARWVRELAARQAEDGHRAVLERAAAAIEQASGPGIVPGGAGQLDAELRRALAAGVVTGSPHGVELPMLSACERVALAAVCAVAAAMPGSVLSDPERELPALAETMEAATATGRTGRAT
ncbi:hypothetical protein OH807_01720 [Kitasatospora sp. NBC_01560]|uniref:hypothetical protein n=1 Tax=Kitasatospora sp. NBC_01560 TaxID=2975965 RepID=UPI0038709302